MPQINLFWKSCFVSFYFGKKINFYTILFITSLLFHNIPENKSNVKISRVRYFHSTILYYFFYISTTDIFKIKLKCVSRYIKSIILNRILKLTYIPHKFKNIDDKNVVSTAFLDEILFTHSNFEN